MFLLHSNELFKPLCWSGNMSISMLGSVYMSSHGTDGWTNDDRGEDVVPRIV